MLSVLHDVPDLKLHPLRYVFEKRKIAPHPDSIWLEFGVATGKSINYISQFTPQLVFGFDSFEGIPENWREGYSKSMFTQHGRMPSVRPNVRLIKGLFSDTLPKFLQYCPVEKKISFLHLDADLYSSTKQVLDLVKDRLAPNCVMVFDEMVNYPGFAGPNGELRAFYEFVQENNVVFECIGMYGMLGMTGQDHQSVAFLIKEITRTKI